MSVNNLYANDNFLIRGVVEGFYGTPWSFTQRINLMPFFKKLNFNTYVYAPKEDPYHREKWQVTYPQKWMENFKKLNLAAKKNNVDFCFALSPGLSLQFSNEHNYHILMEKFKQFTALDVSCFALFFDDIPLELKNKLDKKKFKNSGEAQSYITNKIYMDLLKINKKIKFFFCPTEYWGIESTIYKKTIGKKLNKNIFVFWTGMDIISNEIKTENANVFASLIKRKPVIWDNYPVNDFATGYAFLDALIGRDNNLYQEVVGLLANPMNQFALSKLPLITISDYLNNPEIYNSQNSLQNAINIVGGETGKKYLQIIVENLNSTKLNNYKPTKIDYLSRVFLKDYYKTKDKTKTNKLNSFQNLKAEFIKFKVPYNNLNKIADQDFVSQIKPYTYKLKLYGEIGESILKIFENQQNKKFVEKEKIKLNKKINEVSTMRVVICGKAMVSFIIKTKNIINYL